MFLLRRDRIKNVSLTSFFFLVPCPQVGDRAGRNPDEIPEDWNCGLVVKLPKKGDLTDCGNWRGITLLSVPAKVMGRVIITRLHDAVDGMLREEQAGFRSGRSTTLTSLHAH